jgi:hypothetical protein
MPTIRLMVSEGRWRRAIEQAATDGLLPDASHALTMDDDEVRAIATRIIDLALALELAWLEAEGIRCSVGVTENARTFDLVFASAAAARRFQGSWGGRLLAAAAGGLLH